MNWAKRYGFRISAGVLIFFFLRLGHSEILSEFFVFELIDKILLVYTVGVVLFLWEVLDRVFLYFERKKYDYSRSGDLLKVVFILTLLTFPLVVAASGISEFYIKPSLNCPVYEEAIYKEIGQGQIFAWLIIAARIIQLNAVQSRQLEQDKALVQKELLQSQYQNLKNQIKPHFLFNSFSVLQSLIHVNPAQAEEFLSRLSKMYRYILESREESMSTLEKELEILDHYLFLLRVRHEERIEVSIDVDPSKNNFFVPTLSLQMLVENAEKHNRFSKSEPLRIHIFTEGDYLVVQNQVSKKGAEVVSTKVGLENIRSQYDLQSEQSVIVIENDQTFTVKMPILSRFRLT